MATAIEAALNAKPMLLHHSVCLVETVFLLDGELYTKAMAKERLVAGYSCGSRRKDNKHVE